VARIDPALTRARELAGGLRDAAMRELAAA
jgi:hypothetical protein